MIEPFIGSYGRGGGAPAKDKSRNTGASAPRTADDIKARLDSTSGGGSASGTGISLQEMCQVVSEEAFDKLDTPIIVQVLCQLIK